MRSVTLGVIQISVSLDRGEALAKAADYAAKAAESGAEVILLPEFFESRYFCQERRYDSYNMAAPVSENQAVKVMRELAAKYGVVIPVSFYERDVNTLYNSVAVIDADGGILGVYRKTHIPDDHYYQEKFYFTPGGTGFKVWNTRYGRIGVGICWDQWFPEAARCMALMGAELLLYPTAIGSEPILDCDSMPHWRRCMQGHSAANLIPIAAANRVGTETVKPDSDNGGQSSSLRFYGSSFITDGTGEVVESAGRSEDKVLIHAFNMDELAKNRLDWGVFRDRRPEMYGKITER